MTALIELPDIEAVASRAISNASLRSYSAIPSTPTFPLCVVQRLGGVPVVRQAIDAARIQVDVWATSKSSAFTTAEAARRALLALEGTTDTTSHAFVSAVRDEMGITWMPEVDRDRYTFTVIITARKSS